MKKLIALLLSLALVFALAACGSQEEAPAEETQEETVEPAGDAEEAETEEAETEEAAEGVSNKGIYVPFFETSVEGMTVSGEPDANGKRALMYLVKDDGKRAVCVTVQTFADQASKESTESAYANPEKCSTAAVNIAGYDMTEYTYLNPAFSWQNNRFFYFQKDGIWFEMHAQYDDADPAIAETFIGEVAVNAVHAE